MKSKVKKICIVVSSLGRGGAEQSGALLSIMLDQLGHEIYIVSVLDQIDYPYKGHLLNLGTYKKTDHTIFGRLDRLKKFKAFLAEKKIDIIIDHRSRVQAYREFILSKFIYKVPTIYVTHSFNEKSKFTSYKWLNRWLYQNEYMTSVSEAAKVKYQRMYNLKKIRTIYNGFDFDGIKIKAEEEIATAKNPYIIFYGRLDDQSKNLVLLLEAYKISKLPEAQIDLLILGSGDDTEKIKTHSKSLNLNDHVRFKEFVSNPYPYVKQSKFMVLSSRYEGFPMVIPETLSLGVPVVAVDCQSGPSEVIHHQKNGLLVENHHPQKLAEAMNEMAFNTDLREHCASNAKESVQHLSLAEISKQWNNLIEEVGHD